MGQRVWMASTRMLVIVLRDTLATPVGQVRYAVLYLHLFKIGHYVMYTNNPYMPFCPGSKNLLTLLYVGT